MPDEASAWEQTACLSEQQLKVISFVSQCVAQRPFPAHVSDDTRYASTSTGSTAPDSYVGTLEDAVLHNTNQFHKWHSELEAACASETEEKYKRYADLLTSQLKACEGILAKIEGTLELFDTLLAQQREVATKSKTLHGSCAQLVREKDALSEFADALRAKLRFFDEFEAVYSQFQSAQLSLDNNQFPSLLKKLDDCLAYVAVNPQYADSGQYITKFRQLQGRVLGAVRTKVQSVLKHAVTQVQAAIQETANGSSSGSKVAAGQLPILAEGAEVPLLYVRFRAAAEPNLKGLLKEIETRGNRPEYQRLLAEVQSLYCAARSQLMTPFMQQRIGTRGDLPLPTFARNGCEHVLRVCALESQLFEQFFPGQRESVEALAPLLEPLATVLYDSLRPHIVVLHDIDTLCELVDILKHEVLGDQLSKRGSAGEALRPLLMRTLADVQGRLIFRCQAFIKDEVSGYQPRPEHLDYPALLEKASSPVEHTAEASSSNGDAASSNGHSTSHSTVQASEPLYPPLRSSLLVLSQLYRAVDSRIFGGLAQEVVSACTLSVQNASRQIARKSSPLDAQLFMIKHLLFLREHIAPFDVDFAVTDIDLDFSHMRDHMRRIMAGELSLFTLSSSNAVVRMLGSGGPRVLQYQLDSKKELEKQLKGVCEAFIMALTKVAVEPLLSFITKVTAVKVAAGSNPAAAKPLREQAFASLPKLAEMATKVNEALAGALPAALSKMRLYLPNASTHAILFRPVKANIVEAHAQLASLLDSQYPADEVSQVPLKPQAELVAMLDTLC